MNGLTGVNASPASRGLGFAQEEETMNVKLSALGLGVCLIAGCAHQQVDTSKLNYEAKSMLLQAQYDVEAADRKNVNTVAAHEQLDAAEAAAQGGDSATVIKDANAADKAALLAIKKGK